MRTEFTTAAFERSHGKRPSGRGGWAFQEARSFAAFDRDLTGDVRFFSGTLTEAKKLAAASFGPSALVAVLP